MSTLKVNNIGKTSGSTQDTMEGLCKVWSTYEQQDSTVVHDSHNVSSMTDGGTGKAQVNINNNMNNDDYCVTIGSEDGTGENDLRACHRDLGLTRSTSAFGYITIAGNAAKNDFERSCPMFMGDLA